MMRLFDELFARLVKRLLSLRLSFATRELALSAVLRAAFDAPAVELAFQLGAGTVKAKSGKIRCACRACTHCTSTEKPGRCSPALARLSTRDRRKAFVTLTFACPRVFSV
jgi:hypothetical protein